MVLVYIIWDWGLIKCHVSELHCCCLKEGSDPDYGCPAPDLDLGVRTESDFLDLCPPGLIQCCYPFRSALKQFSEFCTPVGQMCTEPKSAFEDDYMCALKNQKLQEPITGYISDNHTGCPSHPPIRLCGLGWLRHEWAFHQLAWLSICCISAVEQKQNLCT